MQHNSDMLGISDLRMVEYLREFADLRRGLCNLLWPAIMRSGFHMSGDLHLSRIDNVP